MQVYSRARRKSIAAVYQDLIVKRDIAYIRSYFEFIIRNLILSIVYLSVVELS
jgi:hypothetical protein